MRGLKMGVDISGILVKHQTSIKENGGITVSIDAFNIIYQFLSSIRGEDGEPLKDEHEISHHIFPAFFTGQPHCWRIISNLFIHLMESHTG
jgi:membrane associated rhomboid family serine protease